MQQALLQILQPIFEPEFSESSYGFRPGRRAWDAVQVAQTRIRDGKRWVVDMDLEKFFDSIPHAELMKSLARRIVDKRVLHLIKMWLECAVEETDDCAGYATSAYDRRKWLSRTKRYCTGRSPQDCAQRGTRL